LLWKLFVARTFLAETEKEPTDCVKKKREEFLVSWMNQPTTRGLRVRFFCTSQN